MVTIFGITKQTPVYSHVHVYASPLTPFTFIVNLHLLAQQVFFFIFMLIFDDFRLFLVTHQVNSIDPFVTCDTCHILVSVGLSVTHWEGATSDFGGSQL
jgi:hypothetical protein